MDTKYRYKPWYIFILSYYSLCIMLWGKCISKSPNFLLYQPNPFVRSDERVRRHDNRVLTKRDTMETHTNREHTWDTTQKELIKSDALDNGTWEPSCGVSGTVVMGVGWGWWCSPSIPSFLPFPFRHLSHPYPLVHRSSTQQRHPYGTKPNSFGRSDKQVQHDISMVQYYH